jgi:leucyl aminopeptidase
MDAWIGANEARTAVPLIAVDAQNVAAVASGFGEAARRWCDAQGFAGEFGRFVLLPGADGAPQAVLAGCDARDALHALASLPTRLPAGSYRLDPRGIPLDADATALGWALGSYRFANYRKAAAPGARLVVDDEVRARVAPLAQAVFRVRDLVNTPTSDLGPAQLAGALRDLARRHGATFREWVGDELLADGFPTIHAVGRAATEAPRLAMLTHGATDAPHVVLVGKGVCFDTGGLDLKTADGMRWMKKDMGGAAHAIALAGLILETGLPVRLSVLVPAVENAVSGNAYRPGDILRTRSGLSVEVDNTDAEGRLVLCDCLAFAAEQAPDLILDFATLTGAARVALGPDLPALFGNRDDIADALLDAGQAIRDPLWRLPLWRPYLALLESQVADIANSGRSRQSGEITAALLLERFVPEAQAWCHLDVYAWNDGPRPGHPRGGEACGLRACFEFLRRRYAG